MAELKMFDTASVEKHIGTKIRFRDRLKALQPLEDYFRNKCDAVGIEHSYDCTANEPTYFKTLNYTTYAGMFIMHPLCYSHQMFQMYDAKADRLASVGHMEWLRKNLAEGQVSKYVKGNGDELDSDEYANYTDIAVLSGSNKIHQHISKAKLKLLVQRLGSDLLLKPHPITNDKALTEIKNLKGNAQLARTDDDLYALLEKAEVVHTTHISETALTALLMGKKITPLDPFGNRLIGSFSHINHFCFSEADPIETLGSIFASPKSGVVHPEVDTDWKDKIDAYFDYILGQRKLQKNHYYE